MTTALTLDSAYCQTLERYFGVTLMDELNLQVLSNGKYMTLDAGDATLPENRDVHRRTELLNLNNLTNVKSIHNELKVNNANLHWKHLGNFGQPDWVVQPGDHDDMYMVLQDNPLPQPGQPVPRWRPFVIKRAQYDPSLLMQVAEGQLLQNKSRMMSLKQGTFALDCVVVEIKKRCKQEKKERVPHV